MLDGLDLTAPERRAAAVLRPRLTAVELRSAVADQKAQHCMWQAAIHSEVKHVVQQQWSSSRRALLSSHTPGPWVNSPHEEPVVHIAQWVWHEGRCLVVPPLAIDNELVLVVSTGRSGQRGHSNHFGHLGQRTNDHAYRTSLQCCRSACLCLCLLWLTRGADARRQRRLLDCLPQGSWALSPPIL